jgi:hypothetical protein
MFCFAHTPTFYLFIQFLTTGIGGLAFAFYSSWRVSQNDELMSGGFGMLFVYHGGGCMENVSFSSLTQPDLFLRKRRLLLLSSLSFPWSRLQQSWS